MEGFIEGHRPQRCQLIQAGLILHRQRLLQPVQARVIAQPLHPGLSRAAIPAAVGIQTQAGRRRQPLEQLLEQLLQRLPSTARLRLDANGGWDRSTAEAWMQRLRDDPRLDWLEQPLAVEDQAGLDQLAALGPVALDESLHQHPELRSSWSGWQVRRPALEGDPRLLLRELQAGLPQRMLSTAFETGIGRRWLEHLAALQAQGPTPAAPGLAPGWTPAGPMFSNDPEQVWAAAA